MSRKTIEIYGRDDCRFCAAARAHCERKGYPFVYHDMTENLVLAFDLLDRLGGDPETVPQIFIGDHHIGGFEDLRSNDDVIQQIIGGS